MVIALIGISGSAQGAPPPNRPSITSLPPLVRQSKPSCAVAALPTRSIRAVIDLVGNAATAQLGFDCLTKGGKLVIVGLFGGGAPWALPLIPIKAITIQGSY